MRGDRGRGEGGQSDRSARGESGGSDGSVRGESCRRDGSVRGWIYRRASISCMRIFNTLESLM